jgi:hypothetical protein
MGTDQSLMEIYANDQKYIDGPDWNGHINQPEAGSLVRLRCSTPGFVTRGTTDTNRGIALIGPNQAAPFFHPVPVFGSAMTIVFLGGRPRPFHLAGYLLVLAGVIIASRRGSALAGPQKPH